jgi:hypothetical protein
VVLPREVVQTSLGPLVLVFVLSLLSGVAQAEPSVRFTASFVPIAGYPGTGNALGAGAAVQGEYTIAGTEYGGFPPPLTRVNLYLPQGAAVHPAPFASCPLPTIEKGPAKCPRDSSAGPPGKAEAFVVSGEERVRELLSLEPFYTTGAGLDFFLNGHTPVSVELVPAGQLLDGAGRLSEVPELSVRVPLIETVIGAPAGSLSRIAATFGSAVTTGGRTSYYTTIPTTCPTGGFWFKAELTFAAVAGLPEQTVIQPDRATCPTQSAAEVSAPQESLLGTGGVVSAPSNKACVSRRHFTIHILQVKGLVYRRVSVYVNGHRVGVARASRLSAPVDLRGLPKGHYMVTITVSTSTGRRITGTRAYHTCAAKRLPGGNPRL